MIILMLSAYYDNGCAVVRHIKRCREIRRIVIGKTAFFEGHERIFLFLFSPKVKILAGKSKAYLGFVHRAYTVKIRVGLQAQHIF